MTKKPCSSQFLIIFCFLANVIQTGCEGGREEQEIRSSSKVINYKWDCNANEQINIKTPSLIPMLGIFEDK